MRWEWDKERRGGLSCRSGFQKIHLAQRDLESHLAHIIRADIPPGPDVFTHVTAKTRCN